MKKLNLLLVVFFIIQGCTSVTQKVKKDNRPNILFIMSDDHAYQAISSYDDRLIQTPNIDRLAEEGIKFTNACVTNSICAPSRATILTGKFSHLNGKIDNHSPFDTSQVTFPQLFKKAGYQTAMFGKLHFGNNPKGVDDFLILPGQGDYINPKFLGKEKDTIITGYVTDIITDLTIDWFKNKRDESKPFLMMYLHKAPHRAWWPRADKFAEFYEKKFPEPKTLFDDYSNRGSAAKSAEMNLLTHMRYMEDSKVWPSTIKEMGSVEPEIVYVNERKNLVQSHPNQFFSRYGRANDSQKAEYDITLNKISDDFKTNWPTMNDEEKMRWKFQRYMQDYLATISSVDDNVGRVLNYLDENNLNIVTIKKPSSKEITDLIFAFKIAKHVKSNAIIYAKNNSTVGIGAGQMSRIDSSQIAAIKSKKASELAGLKTNMAEGSVLASDAFFPFVDGIEKLVQSAIRTNDQSYRPKVNLGRTFLSL